MKHIDEIRRDPASRRTFLAAMTAAGLGLAASQVLAQTPARRGLTPAGPSPMPSAPPAGYPGGREDFAIPGLAIPGESIDIVVLNFALTLEVLESDLYRQALNRATGRELDEPLIADPSAYTRTVPSGGLNRFFTEEGFEYIRDFTFVEAAHRDFLFAAITAAGGTPIDAAAVAPNGFQFPGGVGRSVASILTAILPLEETGVRAYLGAAPYLTSLGLIQTASTIYSTEARHSAAVSYVINVDSGPRKFAGDLLVTPNQPSENTFEYFLTPAAVLQAASQFIVPAAS